MDEKRELPLGLGMALSQNEAAMKQFEMLSEEEKRTIVEGAHQVRSRQEMQQYVERLSRSE